jgi:AraC-like DNA-binding protein
VGALQGIAPLLQERGIDPAQVLADVGLGAGTLDRPDFTIPYRKAGELIQHCVEITGCAHFGLLIGTRATLSSLNLIGELMRRSPSVQAALRSLMLHLHLQTRGGMPTHTIGAGFATLGYAIYEREMPGAAQGYDLVLAFERNILAALCGPRWRPSKVMFAHVPPRDIGPYREVFDAPLHFNADRTEIVFARKWLDHAPAGADAAQHRALQYRIAELEMMEPDDHAEQVRRTLRTMILHGEASEMLVAKLLAVSVRTLRRLLAAQGTTFRTLMEQARCEIARQLLEHTDMSTSAVAHSLDYADASAFTRAFRRWTDTPPAAWRARVREAAAG